MNDATITLFNFQPESDISSWKIVDDIVMGGISNSQFKINKKGNGEFSGTISLKNNGGFSSLRVRFKQKDIKGYSKICIKLKGDGKNYQFRVKDDVQNSYSYISKFTTNKSWQNIEINLSEMYPVFRGKNLDIDNFSATIIQELAFLIGNKKEEAFCLEIDKIYLQ